MAVGRKSRPQLDVVLHYPVMNDDDLAGAVEMGVGVGVGWWAVGCPASMSHALAAAQWLALDQSEQVVELAGGLPHADAPVVV